MKIVIKLKAKIAFIKAVRLAEDSHAKDGDRYYILPSGDGKLVVVDKMNFKRLRRKHYIGKNYTPSRLVDECFYYTANYHEGGMCDETRRKMMKSYVKWISELPPKLDKEKNSSR